MFRIMSRCSQTGARLGVLETAHGAFRTPVFMPVGTRGTVKAITQEELEQIGFPIILGNTYHLYLRPGHDVIQRAGGLHSFIGWNGAILTDSGGFQVFSLKQIRRIGEDGVLFRSYIDGSEHLFTPERVMEVQLALGADVIMAFDECPPYPTTHDYACESAQRTHAWAVRCLKAYHELLARPHPNPAPALFGIVQGSVYRDLREESCDFISSMPFAGIAVGGVSVGEPKEKMLEVMDWTFHRLPEEKPRYLMGVGTPVDLLDAVERGADMFDCVLPTRLGRNGSAYTTYGRINIKNSAFREDAGPIDPECRCATCRRYSAAYIRHLYMCGEILAAVLLTRHNLHFYYKLMEGIREAIRLDRFPAFKADFLARYEQGDVQDVGADARSRGMG